MHVISRPALFMVRRTPSFSWLQLSCLWLKNHLLNCYPRTESVFLFLAMFYLLLPCLYAICYAHSCVLLPVPDYCKAVFANFVLDLASAGCSACASDSDENRMCNLSPAFLWWEYFQLFPPNFLFSLFSFQFYGYYPALLYNCLLLCICDWSIRASALLVLPLFDTVMLRDVPILYQMFLNYIRFDVVQKLIPLPWTFF